MKPVTYFTFICSSLKDHLPLFNECVYTFIEKLRPLGDGKTEVPMKEMFHDTALQQGRIAGSGN